MVRIQKKQQKNASFSSELSPALFLPAAVILIGALLLLVDQKQIKWSKTAALVPAIASNTENSDYKESKAVVPGAQLQEHLLPASSSAKPSLSYRSAIAYGTKSAKEHTADLVKDAIVAGFRHIVTGNHHAAHNEPQVGEGWKAALEELSEEGLSRSDLFLQTCFVPWDGNDFSKSPSDPPTLADDKAPSIEDQVHHSVKASLQNLQTDYIDAVLFHNFRATLYPYDEMLKAWRVLEDYVKKGTIRYLGMTSIHSIDILDRHFQDAEIKISIVQNRFHANRQFDVPLEATFQKYDIHLQRFWVLNGNAGGIKKNADLARNKKHLTPQQLMLAFVMSLGNTPLVGTHNHQHMKDDIEISKKYSQIFQDVDGQDTERNQFARAIGMKPSKLPLPKKRVAKAK